MGIAKKQFDFQVRVYAAVVGCFFVFRVTFFCFLSFFRHFSFYFRVLSVSYLCSIHIQAWK